MSEIFNFLKKTEAESRKTSFLAPPVMDLPETEPVGSVVELEAEPLVLEPRSTESEIFSAGKLDLSGSTYQLQNVLDPQTIIGEQFRLLRTRLNLLQKQNGIRTILITSAVPQEGKSFTSCGLAGVMAQEEGKRVLVIDADMRKPGSGRDFGFDSSVGQAGTAQVLQGSGEFQSMLLRSNDPGFWFLPAGPLPPNPSELLSSPRLEQLIKAAAEMFDWVIVDSPPVLALSDATMIAPLCDSVLLVLRANYTASKLALEAVNRIGRDRICGVVVNQQKHMHSSKYYYQYYYKKS